MIFFKTTANHKEMLLLEFIEQNKNISQPDIARYIGSSASMVNSYIDNLEKKGYLIRDYKSLKVVEYKITPVGIKRKKFLQITYMKELMKLYMEGQKSVGHFLESILEKGLKDVIFYGAGEIAEILIGIIRLSDIDINVKCIIDDDKKKQNKKINGIDIIPLSSVQRYNHDGIIITSYAFEDEIIKKLDMINYSEEKIVRYFEV